VLLRLPVSSWIRFRKAVARATCSLCSLDVGGRPCPSCGCDATSLLLVLLPGPTLIGTSSIGEFGDHGARSPSCSSFPVLQSVRRTHLFVSVCLVMANWQSCTVLYMLVTFLLAYSIIHGSTEISPWPRSDFAIRASWTSRGPVQCGQGEQPRTDRPTTRGGRNETTTEPKVAPFNLCRCHVGPINYLVVQRAAATSSIVVLVAALAAAMCSAVGVKCTAAAAAAAAAISSLLLVWSGAALRVCRLVHGRCMHPSRCWHMRAPTCRGAVGCNCCVRATHQLPPTRFDST
jgi:hypothetical protein